jgi:hypothetical protein
MRRLLRGRVPAALKLAIALGSISTANAGTDAVAVYDATEVAFDRYVVVKRIGVGDWRSALGMRGHASLDAARKAVLDEAARAGADAVVNLTCFDQTDRMFNPTGYFCYANAIRAKR